MFEAENGEQGIALAREVMPNIILLDYNMPVMDGYHALIEFKSDPALKEIPVIMLTTETVKETVIKLVKLGLKDYIAKPFTREVLLNKLDPILHLFENSDNTAKASSPPSSVKLDPEKQTLVIIDDKQNILDLLKEYFAEQFNVVPFTSGKIALDFIAKHPFDYMFLDLSMPDMNGFEVLASYLQTKRDNAAVKKVIAMTLRTAERDIEKAAGAGIRSLLFKPFNREEANKALDRVFMQQKEEQKKKLQFLSAQGNVRILECPPEKSSKFRLVAGALTSEIVREIDDMAEEGLSQLVIKVGEGFLSDLNITRKFVNVVEHTSRLSLTIRFVAESDQARETLRQFAETASIPTDTSLEFALNSI